MDEDALKPIINSGIISTKILPKYPVYIPSKGRYKSSHTARFLLKDGCPFRLVVEPQEAKEYTELFGADKVLVLPENDQGLIYARNWIKAHATAEGHYRHWQLDDNITKIYRRYGEGRRIPCEAGIALRAVEDFSDRYENIALAGLTYYMFLATSVKGPVFHLNHWVYSCSLILNELPQEWRLVYNDDTDMCLQVLAAGWCTVRFNAYAIGKIRTMIVKGGNTNALYQGDGRLKMARTLERVWPGVVKVTRRYQRPQHSINWSKFTTRLKLKPGATPLSDLPEYGNIKLEVVKETKSKTLRDWVEREEKSGKSRVVRSYSENGKEEATPEQ
jgi:hypothetical protein